MHSARWCIALPLLGAISSCGDPPCTNPCPGAVKIERALQNTQLGPEPVVQCTASNGLVYSYPTEPSDEAACERHLAEWLRVVKK